MIPIAGRFVKTTRDDPASRFAARGNETLTAIRCGAVSCGHPPSANAFAFDGHVIRTVLSLAIDRQSIGRPAEIPAACLRMPNEGRRVSVNASSYPSESLLRAVGHWEERRQELARQGKATGTTVAISREVEAGGTTLALELGKRLGWAVYDDDLLQRIASDLGVHADLLKSVDEHRGNWLREQFERLMGVPHVTESVFVHRLVKVLLALGQHGDCVIVGRGAAFVLPRESTFRVRLVAPRKHRLAAFARRLGIDEFAADSKLTALDRERADFVRVHFSVDPESPSNYDLVLNTAEFSTSECADLVLDGLRPWQRRRVVDES
jgi:cytidylate kinase